MTMRFRWRALLAFVMVVSVTAGAQTGQSLSLHDAEQIAIQNHPQIQAAQALAALPSASHAGAVPVLSTSVWQRDWILCGEQYRIGAGGLNSPRIFDRYGNGLTINQLVTDFGRTHELVKSSNEHAKAEQENV